MGNSGFDLAVIGSGPAGQAGAVAAATRGKRVVVIDRIEALDGVSRAGTIPTKTLREAALFLSGLRQRPFFKHLAAREDIRPDSLLRRVAAVQVHGIEVARAHLRRSGVEVLEGTARFTGPKTLEVEGNETRRELHAHHILVACGSRPERNAAIPFDGRRVIDAGEIGGLPEAPGTLVVVGGGVMGLEHASIFATLGVDVILIEARETLLDFVDRQIVDDLCLHLRNLGVVFRLGERVVSVASQGERVVAELDSGKQVRGDTLLYAVGRRGNADLLHVEAAGLKVDSRGRLAVDRHFRTQVPHIYAAGDVVQFNALAAKSNYQAGVAVEHMFGTAAPRGSWIPYAVYTVPEISMVGSTEHELAARGVDYASGLAHYEDLSRGQILQSSTGCLKLLFDASSRHLLGVHLLGEGATELIHIGQAVLEFGGTVEYFRDSAFNQPTFAEAYRVAATDGLARLAKRPPARVRRDDAHDRV